MQFKLPETDYSQSTIQSTDKFAINFFGLNNFVVPVIYTFFHFGPYKVILLFVSSFTFFSSFSHHRYLCQNCKDYKSKILNFIQLL